MKVSSGAISSAVATVPAPFGSVQVVAGPQGIVAIDLSVEPCPSYPPPNTALLQEAARQIGAYFLNAAFEFSLPLCFEGTVFQRRVWQRLLTIPAGATCTYAKLAASLGSGPRAVGSACRANPLPLLIPCHRVIGTRSAGGYCGETVGPWLAVKHWLLRHERQHSTVGR